MLWSKKESYILEDFDVEADLESAIQDVSDALFGESRIYLDIKRLIGGKGKTKNIPDGYLIDLSSRTEPKLYVAENELAKHDPLKHIAVQILEFSLSFESTPHRIKEILKEGITKDKKAMQKCEQYARKNGIENVDVLLERMIYSDNRSLFNALLIIDEVSEELEKALMKQFNFPVEIITLQRYRASSGKRLYLFNPFLEDVSAAAGARRRGKTIDPAEIDTIVVPAREEGFEETFLGEDRWYQIRIHSSMIPKIRYIAAYQVAPVSAITHIAPVESIEQWKNTSKYVVNFSSPARSIKLIRLVSKGNVKAPQGPRYTSRARLKSAKTLDDVF